MTLLPADVPSSLFLDALPQDERELVLDRASLVEQGNGDELAHPSRPFANVFFPLDSVTSIITSLSDGKGVEAATVGREGFVPALAVFDSVAEPTSLTVVQVPGRALVLGLEAFREIATAPAFAGLAARYVHAYVSMMAQNVACIRAHPLEERCARWILMSHDRAVRDVFPLTQDYLSNMLGVTRPSVTVAAGILQQAGFISYRRGVMEVTDRAGLEASTCECYWAIVEAFRRAIGVTTALTPTSASAHRSGALEH